MTDSQPALPVSTSRRVRRLVAAIVLLGGVAVFALLVFAQVIVPYMSPLPDDLGLVDGALTECPLAPNCVSTYATDSVHDIAPVALNVDVVTARGLVQDVIEAMPQASIVARDDDYWHVADRVAVMGFIDDLEIYIDPETQILHLRSESRIGYDDLGVNRRRAEAFIEAYRQREAALLDAGV